MWSVMRVVAAMVAVVALVPQFAQAQSFPSKSIRMVLPFPPGGPTDALGRIVAQSLSDLVGQLPRLTTLKHNVTVAPHRLYSVLQEFRAVMEAEDIEIDSTDGIKVSLPDGWVHVRASNTESMIRIIVEAEKKEAARELLDWARDRIKR